MNKQKNVTFSIPVEDAEYCGLTPDGEITIHAGEGVLMVTPKEMTVLQAALATRSLIEVACTLIGGIRKTCGKCVERRCADSCPFVDTSSTSFAPPQAAGLTHSAVSPLPTKPEGRLCGGPMRAQRSGSHGERRGKGAQWGMPEGCSPRSGLCPDEVIRHG